MGDDAPGPRTMPPAAATLALLLAAPECGLPDLSPRRPWSPGETLAFDVDVMGVVQAGTLQLRVEPPILGGAQIPLRALVKNTSVFAKVRRVKGSAASFVEAATLRPRRYRDDVDQDGVRRTTDTSFERGSPTVRMAWTSGDQRGTIDFERRQEVLDAVSALYYLRAAELAPGQEICFDLLANRRYWRLRGSVARKADRVDTAAGSFTALRLDARLTRADDPSAVRPLHLWIADDRRRLLVAIVSEVDLGPVRALLSRAPE